MHAVALIFSERTSMYGQALIFRTEFAVAKHCRQYGGLIDCIVIADGIMCL